MLLLDFGNSAIKGQWWNKGELQSSFSCRVSGRWHIRLKSILSDIEATQCYYASVAGTGSEKQLRYCLDEVYGLNGHARMRVQQKLAGVNNGYKDPQKLGVDRWLALLGAADITPEDKIIIDAGSAITIDLLTKKGQHLGGAIMPGFNTSVDRFKQIMAKANFDHPDIQKVDEPGCSTEACIHINCDSTPTDVSMLDLKIGQWLKRLDPNAAVIVAGGDADRISDFKHHPRYEIPDLVFRGMKKQLESQE